MSTTQPISRGPGGKWPKGQSGNPIGRRRPGPIASTISLQEVRGLMASVCKEKVEGPDGLTAPRVVLAMRLLSENDPVEFCRLAVRLLPKDVHQSQVTGTLADWRDAMGFTSRVMVETVEPPLLECENVNVDDQPRTDAGSLPASS